MRIRYKRLNDISRQQSPAARLEHRTQALPENEVVPFYLSSPNTPWIPRMLPYEEKQQRSVYRALDPTYAKTKATNCTLCSRATLRPDRRTVTESSTVVARR